MNVDDLIRLLNNRLREFKLSQNYATMSGDLERVVAADKEIITLEDTLYKLSLLVDASKSATVKETTLTEVVADGSVAVLSEYDITPYATDPLHEEKIMNILSNMGIMDTTEQIDAYIKGSYASSPVTGDMVMSAAVAYTVDARLMMAIMEQDSRFGTVGLAVSTVNPGNVGNDDAGNTRTYDSWQEGVTAVAEWLSRHRMSQVISGISDSAASTSPIATSTPATATSTPVITTSITTTVTTTPVTATSTPTFVPPIDATSTPATATSTPSFTTSTTTPITVTSTTTTATSTLPSIEPTGSTGSTNSLQASSLQATSTTTPAIATSTPPFVPPIDATSTPAAATSTPVITTSTTTPMTAVSTAN